MWTGSMYPSSSNSSRLYQMSDLASTLTKHAVERAVSRPERRQVIAVRISKVLLTEIRTYVDDRPLASDLRDRARLARIDDVTGVVSDRDLDRALIGAEPR